MSNNLFLKSGIVIPESELTVTTSRAGGPGGQHVNKTNSKITIYWNIKNSFVLTPEQKERISQKLHNQINNEGFLIVSNSESRSQEHNKKAALLRIAQIVNQALHVPKKRMKTRVSKAAKEARLQSKLRHSMLKKLRSDKF